MNKMSEKNTTQSNNEYRIRPVSMMVTCAILACLFVLFYAFVMPTDYDNLGGKHAWVSASTIKYVNMWLDEGAADLHFTNYECFPSVELQTKADRLPYVSYPTGVTFMVWSAAKICGKSHIDVSFLKHYQLILYCIEVMIMGAIIYSFLALNIRRDEKIKVASAVCLGTFWMSLPVNNWFLSNIFWTDIAVILWILAFLLLECMEADSHLGRKAKIVIRVLKYIVIFAGVMTEYYFWIVVFMMFVLNFIRNCLSSEDKKVKKAFVESLQYIIPVVCALATYLWQMSATPDWIQQLEDTFLHRTGASADNEADMSMFVKNFTEAITCGSVKRAFILGLAEVLTVGLTVVAFIKKGTAKRVLCDRTAIIVAIMYLSPIIQICIFGNHSAIHQYAMVKFGIHLIGMMLTIAMSSRLLMNDGMGMYIRTVILMGCACMELIAMGYPMQVTRYYEQKNSVLDYSIDRAIKDNTSYEDVCFSYTYEISNNPPMDISVSEKLVYLVTSYEDIEDKMKGLPNEAKAVLVIDKGNIGSNNYEEVDKTEAIKDEESNAVMAGTIIYDDEKCTLVEIER